ncbi:hydroxypyruvate isomerase [Nocardioides thalensis]|uniref:Hydroxypyruvate isomerase n=1 Tax=Nocardioides thalensis TaxID=1914755 RepID=A0A853C6A9_9ACTN|nr:TIM barrel protein [Nocardioides thalensis]NYJ01763.1 hydroxypyruvate isomerase [Nocardioides thalensis]
MSHSLRYDVNCSILFTELPLLERPAAAAAAGFSAVEFWWPFDKAVPDGPAVDAFVSAVRDAGVALVGLNFAAGDMPGGDRGLVSWPDRSIEFRESVHVLVEIGEQLACTAFNALYGNRVDDALPVQQDELALTNLAFAAEAVASIGGTVLIEPISGSPRYPLLMADDAVAVIDKVRADSGATNIALLADLYHLAVNGDDVDAAIAAHVGRVGHVQIADAPGRNEPGTGELPLERQLAALESGGYAGWVGLEYKPSTTTAASLDWLPRERRTAALDVTH